MEKIFSQYRKEHILFKGTAHALRLLLDTLFPDACIGCGKMHTLLCETCMRALPRAERAEYDFINPAFSYTSPLVREAIQRLKYRNGKRIAECFGETLYKELRRVLERHHIEQGGRFLIVPVPLHPRRLRERGYNQSTLLADALMEHDTDGMLTRRDDVLTRVKKTLPQARNDQKKERFKNLKGAFSCTDPDTVRGAIIILIDDVTTTGATLMEARASLLSAKPRAVFALTVSH